MPRIIEIWQLHHGKFPYESATSAQVNGSHVTLFALGEREGYFTMTTLGEVMGNASRLPAKVWEEVKRALKYVEVESETSRFVYNLN